MGRPHREAAEGLIGVSNSVVFSHGKESGPWGSKITAMAEVARDLKFDVLSVDYRGIDDPLARVRKLIETLSAPAAFVRMMLFAPARAASAMPNTTSPAPNPW